jgi:hypothetical protein
MRISVAIREVKKGFDEIQELCKNYKFDAAFRAFVQSRLLLIPHKTGNSQL